MKTAALLLALFLGAASALRAGDGKFEVRAVAPRVGLPGTSEYVLDDGGGDPVTLPLGSEVLLDSTALASAETKRGDGVWIIAVELTPTGAERFGEVTTKFANRRLAILIDGKARCAPIVNSPITSGSFEIAGNFTEDEVKKLVADLNAAADKNKSSATPQASVPR